MALSERDRRTLIIGGGIAGALLLVFLLLNLLGGGGEETAAPTVPVPTGSSLAPIDSPSLSVTPSVVLSFGGRNPFAIPSGLSTVTTSPSGSPSGTGSPSPTQSPTGSPTAPGGGSSHTTQDGRTVVLVDTFIRNGVEKAQVTVGSTTYTVEEGEQFAGSFEIRSIDGDCATIDHGDESFTLCANPQK
jgi:hypothetical protein